jgi:hypothetical protein
MALRGSGNRILSGWQVGTAFLILRLPWSQINQHQHDRRSDTTGYCRELHYRPKVVL